MQLIVDLTTNVVETGAGTQTARSAAETAHTSKALEHECSLSQKFLTHEQPVKQLQDVQSR